MKLSKRIWTLLFTVALVLAMFPIRTRATHNAEDAGKNLGKSFYQELAELVRSRNEKNGGVPADDSDPYSSARLVVLADEKLHTELLDDAETCLYDGSGMWVIQFESPAAAEATARLLSSMGIESQPDTLTSCVEGVEEDGLTHALASGHYSWGVADAHFDSFISKYASAFTGSGVVAVVDSGVDAAHPFLRGKVLEGYDFIDFDTDAADENDHGTLVASVIVDCVGNAPVSILPVRVLDGEGHGYMSFAAAGVKYAADHGADVINLSLGGEHTIVMEEAVEYAVECGAIVVTSAGNESDSAENYCPADMAASGIVVVVAGDAKHKRAEFSNFGKSVDLMASGVDVRAAIVGGSYAVASGTSMAAPHVSAAAMLLDLVWGKALTPAELENKLCEATTSGGNRIDNYCGYGSLDMAKARVPASAEPAPAPSAPVFQSASVTPGVYHVEAYCGKVVEVEDSRTDSGANVQLWALSNRDLKCQRFDIQPSGSGYVLKAVHSKKAIDVADGATASGTNVWQWGLNQTPAQTWTFEDAGDGYVYIKSGLKTYLTVKNNGTANGTNVVSCTFDGSNAQKFKLVSYGAEDSGSHGKAVSVAAGTYYLEASCGKIVEVEDSKTASGANVQLWALSSRNLGCQKWQIAASNGGYVVKAKHSGKALDVADGSAASGTNVWQWGLNQTAAQTWTFEDAGDGYVYIRSGLRTYLTVKDGGTANGTNVVSCLFDGSSAQRFKLVKA